MSVRIYVEGDKAHGVRFELTDDFYYFRDSIHEALEDGEFGTRFPTFMIRFEGDQWTLDEIPQLQNELKAIASAFRAMPPEPLDFHWPGRSQAVSSNASNLYEVFVDDAGRPALEALIELCQRALQNESPIRID